MLAVKSNKQYNELLTKTILITNEKNILIQINIILSNSHLAYYEFKLHLNGKQDCESTIYSKNEHIINHNSFMINKLKPGEYKIELLYLTNTDSEINMNSNDWDNISMNILLLEV